MNQFLGIKVKRLFVVLLLAPLFVVPSICSAVNACISGTPILNVIAPNPKAPGGNVSYSVKAVGSGFATFELWASDKGVLKSGTFSSGQTVSGNYNTPSGRGIVTFKIKDSSGNVIPYCYANADITFGQDTCEQNFKDERKSNIWGKSILIYPAYWGEPTYYFFCSRYASPRSRNYLANFSNTGLVNSGNVRDDQMVIGFYRIPFGAKKETYSFTTPGSRRGWENDYGFDGAFFSWATSALPCKASFSLSGALTAGNNIQFNANAANIAGYRPDNYKWKVDWVDYLQGNDKNVVYGSFPSGNHSISLTIDDGLGTSCSSSQTITIPVLPPPPSCAVSGMSATPSTANFGTNVNFTANISGTGIVSYIWKDGATPLGVNVAMPGTGGVATNNHIFAGAANITKTITLIGTLSDGRICQGNVSVNLTVPPLPPPLPCTVNFDVRNSTKSCLTSSCNYNEPISFSASAFVNPGTITGYTWTMSKVGGGNEAFEGSNTNASALKTFVPADGQGHKIHLAARDSNGNTCTMDKTINVKLSMPGWNEIAPYLMQLGPIGFLVLVFLARIIFLRL